MRQARQEKVIRRDVNRHPASVPGEPVEVLSGAGRSAVGAPEHEVGAASGVLAAVAVQVDEHVAVLVARRLRRPGGDHPGERLGAREGGPAGDARCRPSGVKQPRKDSRSRASMAWL